MRRHVACGLAVTLSVALVAGGCTSNDTKGEGESRVKAAQTNAQLGMTYMQQGNLNAARDRIEKALTQDPRTPETQMAAGFLYDRLGDDRKAQTHYDQAVRLAEGDPDVLNNAAVFYCRKGDKKRGEKLFLEAAANALYRTPAAAYTNAGRCARADGRPVDAETYFRRALDFQPDQPDALLQMAGLNHESGNDFQARAFLQRYMSVGPANSSALWLGYQIERALGDHPQSQEYARRLRTEFATSAETRELLEAEQGG
jgi:type IV pilus assembly protein PilF